MKDRDQDVRAAKDGAAEGVAERGIAALVLVVFWLAAAALAVGLLFWLRNHESRAGAILLAAGLIQLMLLPTLRLVSALAAARRSRDWLTLSSTLVVLAILLALTLRDASSLR